MPNASSYEALWNKLRTTGFEVERGSAPDSFRVKVSDSFLQGQMLLQAEAKVRAAIPAGMNTQISPLYHVSTGHWITVRLLPDTAKAASSKAALPDDVMDGAAQDVHELIGKLNGRNPGHITIPVRQPEGMNFDEFKREMNGLKQAVEEWIEMEFDNLDGFIPEGTTMQKQVSLRFMPTSFRTEGQINVRVLIKEPAGKAAPASLRQHPQYSDSDYNYLRGKGYNDQEILDIWKRDAETDRTLGRTTEPVEHKPIPDLMRPFRHPNDPALRGSKAVTPDEVYTALIGQVLDVEATGEDTFLVSRTHAPLKTAEVEQALNAIGAQNVSVERAGKAVKVVVTKASVKAYEPKMGEYVTGTGLAGGREEYGEVIDISEQPFYNPQRRESWGTPSNEPMLVDRAVYRLRNPYNGTVARVVDPKPARPPQRMSGKALGTNPDSAGGILVEEEHKAAGGDERAALQKAANLLSDRGFGVTGSGVTGAGDMIYALQPINGQPKLTKAQVVALVDSRLKVSNTHTSDGAEGFKIEVMKMPRSTFGQKAVRDTNGVANLLKQKGYVAEVHGLEVWVDEINQRGNQFNEVDLLNTLQSAGLQNLRDFRIGYTPRGRLQYIIYKLEAPAGKADSLSGYPTELEVHVSGATVSKLRASGYQVTVRSGIVDVSSPYTETPPNTAEIERVLGKLAQDWQFKEYAGGVRLYFHDIPPRKAIEIKAATLDEVYTALVGGLFEVGFDDDDHFLVTTSGRPLKMAEVEQSLAALEAENIRLERAGKAIKVVVSEPEAVKQAGKSDPFVQSRRENEVYEVALRLKQAGYTIHRKQHWDSIEIGSADKPVDVREVERLAGQGFEVSERGNGIYSVVLKAASKSAKPHLDYLEAIYLMVENGDSLSEIASKVKAGLPGVSPQLIQKVSGAINRAKQGDQVDPEIALPLLSQLMYSGMR